MLGSTPVGRKRQGKGPADVDMAWPSPNPTPSPPSPVAMPRPVRWLIGPRSLSLVCHQTSSFHPFSPAQHKLSACLNFVAQADRSHAGGTTAGATATPMHGDGFIKDPNIAQDEGHVRTRLPTFQAWPRRHLSGKARDSVNLPDQNDLQLAVTVIAPGARLLGRSRPPPTPRPTSASTVLTIFLRRRWAAAKVGAMSTVPINLLRLTPCPWSLMSLTL